MVDFAPLVAATADTLKAVTGSTPALRFYSYQKQEENISTRNISKCEKRTRLFVTSSRTCEAGMSASSIVLYPSVAPPYFLTEAIDALSASDPDDSRKA